MDLIRIDIIIDKMATLVCGLHHIFICKLCDFHNMGLLDNEGKMLASMMLQCEIIAPGETRPKF